MELTPTAPPLPSSACTLFPHLHACPCPACRKSSVALQVAAGAVTGLLHPLVSATVQGSVTIPAASPAPPTAQLRAGVRASWLPAVGGMAGLLEVHASGGDPCAPLSVEVTVEGGAGVDVGSLQAAVSSALAEGLHWLRLPPALLPPSPVTFLLAASRGQNFTSGGRATLRPPASTSLAPLLLRSAVTLDVSGMPPTQVLPLQVEAHPSPASAAAGVHAGALRYRWRLQSAPATASGRLAQLVEAAGPACTLLSFPLPPLPLF